MTAETERSAAHISLMIICLARFVGLSAYLPVNQNTLPPFASFFDKNDIVDTDISMQSIASLERLPRSWRTLLGANLY